MNRSVLFAVLASFITGALNSIVYLFWIANSLPEIGSLVVLCLVGGTVVLGFVIVWGLPMHFLLKRYNKISVKWYVLIGAIPALVIPIDSYLGAYYSNLIAHTLFAVYVGVAASLAFVFEYRRNST
ncbi:MAG: hypothetical protein HRT52_22120 [Colwellia sp.]|nr:hypothetical protein [Colwellia sp.]NQZ83706.1 hypothetical protein [Colwellia sp.]